MRLAKQIPPEDKKTTRGMSLRGYLFGFIALCFILGSGIIIIQWSTIKTGFHNQIAEAGFKLETVEINGRNHTTHQELNDALKLQNGEPILSINLTEKRLQIEQLGWVESAYLERLLPNTLRLTIIERTPIALLQTDEGHQLIDDNGAIINGAAPETFSHLPVVSGKDAARSANHLIEILKTEPELYAEIWAIQHISKRRWNVHMKNG
ncbi:MAG: FtsQ-type POTRA domain-containing protein, partial [Alphaproteobacteria bacterium]|nr:FtsQ-type POTRA domain-containing protein [Alphaproteobacteria bacterium]